LKPIEKKRFEKTVEKALMDQGKAFVRLLITKRLTLPNNKTKTNEESTDGEFNVDFCKLFRK
jgi:hypothetical protein